MEVQDCGLITNHYRGICRIYPNLIKENRGISSTCNPLDLHTIGSQLGIMPKNLPDHWSRKASKAMIRENQKLLTDEPVEF